MDTRDTSTSDAVLAQTEYRLLRETIQSRGALRFIVAALTFPAWGALALWCWTSQAGFIAGLIPLFVLSAGFEIVLSIHTGVERIGRYVQLMFEDGGPTPPAWEHVAVAMGPRWHSPGGQDALFSMMFIGVTAINFVVVGAQADSTRQVVLAAVVHLMFMYRVLMARWFAKLQRKIDLAALESVISSNALVSRIQQRR